MSTTNAPRGPGPLPPDLSVAPWPLPLLASEVVEHTIVSQALCDNPLGDAHERPLWVQAPREPVPGRRYPVAYVLPAYNGHITMWRNRLPYRLTTIEEVELLTADPTVPDLIVVYVESWSRYGGSQFVDSPGTGRYESYLCDEVVPFVDAHYPTLTAPEGRAVTGKSSGGYGALALPLRRPDLFGCLASHAGDALFETCFLPGFPLAARALAEFDGDIHAYWDDFRSRVSRTKPYDYLVGILLGVAASFSAADDGAPILPFDPRSGRLRPEVWQRWLDRDPVRMLERPEYAAAGRGLHAVWVDAGTRDEHFLDLGAAAFVDALTATGLPGDRVHFELFEDGHPAVEYRYPPALRWLAERMSGSAR
ncbi:alpha/beta hydrolase family protein [Nocardioides sp. L-11A]|uniref:alpha/beta hydrolase n=1 Tax=Nocardioides sp. L-11A TaxID=3043848 RepID=UPI002499C3C1|nr:alpha/beta hydrolase-fold protein [Nocardioides sp. L-11A]